MITIRRILVPTDLSEHSLAALSHASTFAMMYDASLYMMYVAGEDMPIAPILHGVAPDADILEVRSRRDAMADLEEFIRLNVNVHRKITPIVRIGHPVEEICKFAAAERIDLIVMATHGRSGLMHVLIGSVAEKLVRSSPVPVMTVKPDHAKAPILTREEVEEGLHLRS